MSRNIQFTRLGPENGLMRRFHLPYSFGQAKDLVKERSSHPFGGDLLDRLPLSLMPGLPSKSWFFNFMSTRLTCQTDSLVDTLTILKEWCRRCRPRIRRIVDRGGGCRRRDLGSRMYVHGMAWR